MSLSNVEEVIKDYASKENNRNSKDEDIDMTEEQEENCKVMIECMALSMAAFQASRKDKVKEDGSSRILSDEESEEESDKEEDEDHRQCLER